MKNLLFKKTLGIVSVLVMLTACVDDYSDFVFSDSVATFDIYATYQVISDGYGDVYVEAQLTRGIAPSESDDTDTFIRLSKGDELWVSHGDSLLDVNLSDGLLAELPRVSETQVKLEETNVGGQAYIFNPFYVFLFDRVIINVIGDWYFGRIAESENNVYRVSLLRDSGGLSADDSYVSLPLSFMLNEPVSGQTYSRSADDIFVRWNTTEADIAVEVAATTTCADHEVDTYSITLDSDTGEYTIPAGELDSPLLDGTCSTTINVRKISNGVLDSKYAAGIINGFQIRRQVINTTN